MARHSSSPGVAEPTAGHVEHAAGRIRRPVVLNLLISLRPGQWPKNLLIFAGLIFGQRLFDAAAVRDAMAAFAIFCGLSGVVYLLNDVADRERVATALGAAAVLGAAALAGAFAVSVRFGVVSIAYILLHALYTGVLKHVVIIDVLAISIGFVLRAVAGAVAVNVEISHWLLVCTILLALFVALAKRRHELVLLADAATMHRRILGEYSPYLLDQMISVVTASTLVAYVFYTISPETEAKFATHWLGLTIPFPLYGIFRYLYLVHRREGGGSPAELLLTDRPLLMCIALWGLALVLLIYKPF
jgi:4-hydroxybenzoate polyprenyltransferase